MTKTIRLAWAGISTGIFSFGTLVALAHGNDRGEIKATVGNARVSIEYGRPVLKGRDMLKRIEPGKLWRIGADAPTTIESDADLNFGGTVVPKGKHVLLARLIEPGKWSLVVSSKNIHDYEPSAKLAEVPMEIQESKDLVELVTILLSNKNGVGVIEIAWGTMRLQASFTEVK